MHKHSFTHTHCSICRASFTLDLHGSVSDRGSLVELKMNQDGPVQVEALDPPTVTCLLPPPNATTAPTVRTGTEHDGQTHNVLKCWILFVLMDSVLTTNKTFQLNSWRLLQSRIRIMETFWEGLSLHKWFFKLISRMTRTYFISSILLQDGLLNKWWVLNAFLLQYVESSCVMTYWITPAVSGLFSC